MLFYCIVGQVLLEMIPHLSSSARKSFTLSHPDLHLGNIYVDADFNITCIVDWSSMLSGPITELLGTPPLGGSAAPPSEYLVAAFRSGFTKRAAEVTPELSRSRLWEKSDRMWHFSRLVGLLSKNDYEQFRKLFELVYKASNEGSGGRVGILSLFHERANRVENQKLLAEPQKEDRR